MATQESQYWKFLEENPGSTLTFEEWQKHMAKKLFGYVEELTENPLDKLEDELDGFENVRYRMDAEGLHYCFKHYSSFKNYNKNRKIMEKLLSKTNYICKLNLGLKMNCKTIAGLIN